VALKALAPRLAAWILTAGLLVVCLVIWDSVLFDRLRLTEAGYLRAFWGGCAYWLGMGGVQVAILALGALLARFWVGGWNHVRRALAALAAVAISGVSTQLIKHLVGRPRPRMNLSWLELTGPALSSDLHSLPSGHAATSFALAMYLGLKYPRWAWLFLLGAALVAAGRVMSLSHYPSDVVAGAWLGLAVGWLVDFLERKKDRRRAI
jgi:membrane-associated phospholipid phosphatase